LSLHDALPISTGMASRSGGISSRHLTSAPTCACSPHYRRASALSTSELPLVSALGPAESPPVSASPAYPAQPECSITWSGTNERETGSCVRVGVVGRPWRTARQPRCRGAALRFDPLRHH